MFAKISKNKLLIFKTFFIFIGFISFFFGNVKEVLAESVTPNISYPAPSMGNKIHDYHYDIQISGFLYNVYNSKTEVAVFPDNTDASEFYSKKTLEIYYANTGKIETYSVPVRTDIVNENSNFGLPKESVPELVTFLSNKENAGIPVYFRLSKDNSNQAGYWNGPNTFEVPFDADEHKPVINQPTEGDQVVSGTGVPGDTIVITDGNGNELGTGTVDGDGKFEIPVNRPLEKGETITGTPETDGQKGTPGTTVVAEKPFDPEAHKPVINQPTEGDQVVSGTGVPGDTIIITDGNGNELGTGTVDGDGKFEIPVNRPLEKGETITGTPETDGQKGTPGTTVVAEKPFDPEAHKPVINQPTEGDQVVSRTGVPGDTIIITDGNGNELGTGTVDGDGKFEIPVNRPLEKGETITGTPETDGQKGTPGTTVVAEKPFDPEAHKPVINQPTEGDQVVSGTGVPGDTIIITDGNGNELGTGTVDGDGKFEIPVNRPLEKGETITGTPETDGQKGTPGTTVVAEKPFDPEAHKPVINQPTEGDQVVSGTGVPGDTIIITDGNGNELGTGTVDGDGKFEIPVNRPLEKGETITGTPETDGQKGTPGTTVVAEKPFDPEAHKPVINQPTEGDQVVSGTGVPGDTIVITDGNGNELGTGTVDGDGKFEVPVNRPLEKGETITGTPETDGQKGTPGTTVVAEKPFDPEAHKPVINQPTEGDQVVSGTGVPGDTIIITDGNGNELGTGTVDGNGKFEIPVNRPLEKGETITGTPETDGQKGTPGTTVVAEKPFDPEAHKPVINQPTEGDQVVSGTGVPGDTIIITDGNGNELGTGTVDGNGKFEIPVNRPLEKGETITGTPETDGQKGTPGTTVVAEKPFDPEAHKPVINQPTEGDQVVSGTGVPGDTIIITDGNGNELGTGTVNGNGKFEIPVNRPLEKGETITGTPETDGQKGTPGTTVVAKKSFDPEAHKPVINQPTEGNQVVSDAKNSNSNQGKERYALPKMGEKDNLFLYCVGLLLIIFILSIILYRKSDFEAK